MNWFIPTTTDWNSVAREIVAKLNDGDILTLSGPLGAGKTTFVQALAQALGSEKLPKSPTFSMLRTYSISGNGLSRLLHVDAYRIENEIDLITLDLDEELLIPGTILVIEWPEHIPAWLETRPHLALTIEIDGDGRRASMENRS
ncbi:MAG: tRNA (adenosine(37)-N6)-threonylcarbamoyltransferase complex ATPase subunit type 1 TsaE [Patescibacteria group bacterium]